MLAYYEEDADPVLERAETEIRVLEKMLKEANRRVFLISLIFGVLSLSLLYLWVLYKTLCYN